MLNINSIYTNARFTSNAMLFVYTESKRVT